MSLILPLGSSLLETLLIMPTICVIRYAYNYCALSMVIEMYTSKTRGSNSAHDSLKVRQKLVLAGVDQASPLA